MKTEPGEAGESKPNLRRRMGSFVAKPEPGQTLVLKVKIFYSNTSLKPQLFNV